jgi:hypothetical protein
MRSEVNPFDALGVAAHRKLRAQDELAAANAALSAALRSLNLAGLPKCKVASVARLDLSKHGFEPEQISRLAISDASVRLILDRK